MDIAPISQNAAQATSTAVESPGAAGLSSDFETFLRMLTAQMRNQDPLDPVDSADFAVQLATFSNVEQQVRTNDLLTAMSEKLGGSDMGQMAAWIGKDVRSAAPVLFQGQPVMVSVQPVPAADKTELVVRNASGTEVGRSLVPNGVREFDWVGVDAEGVPLADGQYTLTTESYIGNDVTATHPAEFHSTITEVQFSGGEPVLKLKNGQTIPIADVRALSASASI